MKVDNYSLSDCELCNLDQYDTNGLIDTVEVFLCADCIQKIFNLKRIDNIIENSKQQLLDNIWGSEQIKLSY